MVHYFFITIELIPDVLSADESEDEIVISSLSDSPKCAKNDESLIESKQLPIRRSTARKSTAPRKSASAQRKTPCNNGNGVNYDCNEKTVTIGNTEDDDDDICILDVKESDQVKNHQLNANLKNFLPDLKKTNNNAENLLIVISDSD